MTWARDAACLDYPPEWWFPPHGPGGFTYQSRAKAVCARCPVTRECLAFALDTLEPGREHGIWGGLARPGLRRARARAAQIDGSEGDA